MKKKLFNGLSNLSSNKKAPSFPPGNAVARVELYHYASPLPATFRPSWIPGYPQNKNRCTLIHIITEDGVEGWSAGPAMEKEHAGLGGLIGPYLIGEDATNISRIQQRLREMSYIGLRNWWIEPAFWDIKGKIAGLPLCRLLGAEPTRVQLYASTGQVRYGKERIEEAQARYDEGFRQIKIRVHGTEKEDIAQVRETLNAIGNKMSVGVDANQGWRITAISDAPLWDLDRAKRFADVCADLGVAWIEEPLAMDAYHDLTELTSYSKVPISGGELHTGGYAELAMMVERGCYKIFQPDAMFSGGVEQTFRLIEKCKLHGLTYTPHTWTNGIGFAVNLQLMAASGFSKIKKMEYPIDPPGWTPEARDSMLEEPFFHQEGELDVPSIPGLGFRINSKALRKYGKRFFMMDRKRLIFAAIRNHGLAAALEIHRARTSV